ncbi:MAG: hypothetical protein AAFX39_02835 [Pseudomonadota bacterium]
MTSAMLRALGVATGTAVLVSLALPAAAQDCASNIQQVESVLQTANLSGEELAQINTTLMEAQAQLSAGNEEGCQATLQPVMDALGVAG